MAKLWRYLHYLILRLCERPGNSLAANDRKQLAVEDVLARMADHIIRKSIWQNGLFTGSDSFGWLSEVLLRDINVRKR